MSMCALSDVLRLKYFQKRVEIRIINSYSANFSILIYFFSNNLTYVHFKEHVVLRDSC
jgi:hypothetical protein